jgi:hypothetical protein
MTKITPFSLAFFITIFIWVCFFTIVCMVRILVVNPFYYYASAYPVREFFVTSGVNPGALLIPRNMSVYPIKNNYRYEISGKLIEVSREERKASVKLEAFNKNIYHITIELDEDPSRSPQLILGDTVIVGWEVPAKDSEFTQGTYILSPTEKLLGKTANVIRPI